MPLAGKLCRIWIGCNSFEALFSVVNLCSCLCYPRLFHNCFTLLSNGAMLHSLIRWTSFCEESRLVIIWLTPTCSIIICCVCSAFLAVTAACWNRRSSCCPCHQTVTFWEVIKEHSVVVVVKRTSDQRRKYIDSVWWRTQANSHHCNRLKRDPYSEPRLET